MLEIAYATAKLSKDKSTQVGALILGASQEIRSLGYNGAPRGVVLTKTHVVLPALRSTSGSVTLNSTPSHECRTCWHTSGWVFYHRYSSSLHGLRSCHRPVRYPCSLCSGLGPNFRRAMERTPRSIQKLFEECGVEFHVL